MYTIQEIYTGTIDLLIPSIDTIDTTLYKVRHYAPGSMCKAWYRIPPFYDG